MKGKRIITTALASLLLAGTAPSQEGNRSGTQTIIVLDASGSMWGQIDGKAKIDIAKEVIEDLLKTLDPKLELGLMAYGHRRKGDCADIELMIPPGHVERANFLETVRSISPKGKTPLTDSVEAAAKYLKYEEHPGSVILVSDGIENCDRDPCELAKILRKNGINFKAHVIAFDLTEKDALTIKCLADETGGQFLPAQDAGTLQDALQIAVREVVELAGNAGAKPEAKPSEVPPPPPAEKLDPAILRGPAQVVAGSRFNVEWEGPDNRGDRVGIVVRGSPDNASGNFRYTFVGKAIELVAPVEPGPCELRYRTPRGKILGRANIDVVEASATIKAPAEMVAGLKVTVGWTGPENRGDSIRFAPVGSPATESAGSRYVFAGQKSTEIHAPVEPGNYEVRYVTARNPKILASQAVKVVPAEATVRAPESVMGGAPFETVWTGPKGQGDMVAIARKGEQRTISGHYHYAFKGSPAIIDAPIEPGNYEVRYIGRGNKTLASYDFTVTEPVVTLRGPRSAMAGASIDVSWTGPGAANDFIVVTARGAPDSHTAGFNYVKNGNPVPVVVPESVGEGEVRYVAGRRRTVIKRLPVTITEPKATISAPLSVKARSRVSVRWTGPGNRRDFIMIAAPESPADKAVSRRQVGYLGSECAVQTPKEPGTYELRYVTGGGKILASQPLEVE